MVLHGTMHDIQICIYIYIYTHTYSDHIALFLFSIIYFHFLVCVFIYIYICVTMQGTSRALQSFGEQVPFFAMATMVCSCKLPGI